MVFCHPSVHDDDDVDSKEDGKADLVTEGLTSLNESDEKTFFLEQIADFRFSASLIKNISDLQLPDDDEEDDDEDKGSKTMISILVS